MLFSSRVRVRIRVRIRLRVWLVSCYAHVFVLLSIVIVIMPVIRQLKIVYKNVTNLYMLKKCEKYRYNFRDHSVPSVFSY